VASQNRKTSQCEADLLPASDVVEVGEAAGVVVCRSCRENFLSRSTDFQVLSGWYFDEWNSGVVDGAVGGEFSYIAQWDMIAWGQLI
jgi:hypothetical protein